jgi:hypothetical protein
MAEEGGALTPSRNSGLTPAARRECRHINFLGKLSPLMLDLRIAITIVRESEWIPLYLVSPEKGDA